MDIQNFQKQIFAISGKQDFDSLAFEVFRYQASENSLYKEYLQQLKVKAEHISKVEQIPFLPVEFFKSHTVCTGSILQDATVFSSSGTTGKTTSRHFVKDLSIYESSFREAFKLFYGDPSEYCILALLPSYLEREGSSLLYMVQDLMDKGNDNGFYLNNLQDLAASLIRLHAENKNILLIGVTYALLDMAASYPVKIPGAIVMETGGMKGKRKEVVREALHQELCQAFGVQKIHSEYGMTELFSQAYSKGDGCFKCPPWMQVLIRDTNDPLALLKGSRTGGINVIDLANVHSCSFIATQDLGRVHADGSFEVLGRFGNSDIRGCNLLVD
jgi:hypothetical protein